MANHSKAHRGHPEMLADLDVRDAPEDQVQLDQLVKMARREAANIVQSRVLHQDTLVGQTNPWKANREYPNFHCF